MSPVLFAVDTLPFLINPAAVFFPLFAKSRRSLPKGVSFFPLGPISGSSISFLEAPFLLVPFEL
jgi:hypothetical protein